MKNKLFLLNVLLIFLIYSCGSDYYITNTETGEQSDNTKLITSYSINNVTGIIGENIITLTLPYGTNITNLVASFEFTGVKITVDGIEQVSGVTTNNFTEPVVYNVTAEDNTTNYYIVKVYMSASYEKDITLFEIPNQVGQTEINEDDSSISLMMPFDTNLTSLVAVFNTTGEIVFVDDVEQISGLTENDFSSTVIYTVEAADGTTKNYTVEIVLTYSLRQIGPAGGLIFYINPNYENDGWLYLEAAPYDQSSNQIWSDIDDPVPNGTATDINTGLENTTHINEQSSNSAGGLCFDTVIDNDFNTYDDWFLPSKDELFLMYLNLVVYSVGDFAEHDYASSSEGEFNSINGAWRQRFFLDYLQYTSPKSHDVYVRCVRSF